MNHEHEAYVCPHPRREGYFVYCADCNLVTDALPTQEEAIAAWKNGSVHEETEQLDRSEYVGFRFIGEFALKRWEEYLGKTRDEIKALLGEPDDCAATNKKHPYPGILSYRKLGCDIEFHFTSDKRRDAKVWLVFDNVTHKTLAKQ